ncbi:MAG: aminodeoxychorismate synthase, component [Chthonomonadaceae bacterium]|nr:aminodeoxychorismate synthase, component [Chthonomonadaceae bacterium]
MQGDTSEVRLCFDFVGEESLEPLLLTRPVRTIAAYAQEEVLPALQAVQAAVSDQGLYAAGFVSYEAAPAFDPAMQVRIASPLPLVWFGLFTAPTSPDIDPSSDPFAPGLWEASLSETQFTQDIAQIRAAIAAGECYQVNHTLRLRAPFTGDDFAWYRRLQAAQQADYSAYLDLGRYRILSVSPELFFYRAGDRILTRPMKGTLPRGRWEEEDTQRAQELVDSEKERAENIMIVDLLRNDLGRIACTGSVQVEKLFAVERYPTVLQMTSTVAADLPPATTLTDLFIALFPCGSVTGAPKISAMHQIAMLETAPRQVYCGAIGYLVPNGPTVFNVAIRTVLLDTETGVAEYGVGSGITWDSTPQGEYAENRLKAQVLEQIWPRFDLLETLRLEQGVYTLLSRHVDRLCASARYFGIPLQESAVQSVLLTHAQALDTCPWRIRLLVTPRGEIRTETFPLNALPPEGLRAALALSPVSRRDRFLFHKTTHRIAYTTRRAERPDLDETLLWNEEGELTEFTTGNLVVERDGHLWTPPLDCGLLPGTLRAELLAKGEISERVLHPSDLEAATAVWLINSVRGWVAIRLVS